MKKKLIKKAVSYMMVITLLLTTILTNVNTTFADPTNTRKFLKIPHRDEPLVEFNWRETVGGNSGYSSWDEDDASLKIPTEYGFKFYPTSDTTFTVTAGTTGAAPSSFNGETLNPELTDNMKSWKWFNLSDNTAGNIEVKITNMKIYQPDSQYADAGGNVLVDIIRTVTKIDRNSEMNGQGWIALGQGISSTIYIGVDEVTTKNTFYRAGTDNKINIKSNLTVTDVDTYQYVAVNKDEATGHYVSGRTHLYYGEKEGKCYYASTSDENADADAWSAVGFTFQGTSFTYTFGRCVPEGDGIAKPTNQYQYIGTGQNMAEIPLPEPVKTVSNSEDEERALSNVTRSVAKSWIYYVTQATPTDIPEKWWYEQFVFTDQIDTCLEIMEVNMYATDKDGETSKVNRMFDIEISDSNKVTATMYGEYLQSASTYRNVEYEMRIKVRWKVPDDIVNENYKTKWENHHHLSGSTLTVDNDATVTVQDKQSTNVVTTTSHLPELNITKNVDHYEYQVGDTISYTLNVWNSNADANVAYWWIKDISLPDSVKLDTSSINISGIDSDAYEVETTDNGFIIKASGTKTLAYGNTITVNYNATALKEGNGTLVDNTAYTGAQGVDSKNDSEQIYINSPKVDVRKSAPQRKYKVGDVVGYTVEIDNRNAGTFMRDLVLNDLVTTPGMQIKEGTVAVLVGGKDITSQCDITYNEDSTGFTIDTGLNLKSGTIPCIDKSPYDSISNWCDKIKVTYDAVITEEAGESCDNTFTVPATDNTNGDKIRDDEDVPSGGGSDEEKVPMKAPQLEITKTSDKQTYKVGETGTYTLVVKQIKEELTAKNVVITDAFEQKEGMTYDKDSFKVMLNKEDITSKCNVSVENNTFKIETHQDLTDEDKLTITYDVKFSQTGTYKNVAIASSDNTNDDDDDNIITVEGDTPKLDVQKTSDKKEYNIGEIGKYTLQVKQTKPGLIAENVVVQDNFEQKEGIKIAKSSIKVMLGNIDDTSGASIVDITSECKITAEDTNFKVETNKNLSSDKVLVVTYDVQFEKVGEYKNAVVASSDNTDDDDDDNTIKVKDSPKLDIQKTSDKDTYKIGDIGKYTLQIKQTVSGAVAENVVIKDAFEQKDGMKIVQSSIKVLLGGENITSTCTITADNSSFTIETHKNLSSDEVLVVTYDVRYSQAGTYKNAAIASSDNTPDSEGENTVSVQEKEVPETNPPKNTPNDTTPSGYSSPKTGEQAIHISLIIALIAIVAGIVAVAVKKKRGKIMK